MNSLDSIETQIIHLAHTHLGVSLFARLSTAWTGKTPAIRSVIRKQLYEDLRNQGDSSCKYSEIMALETPPHSPSFGISISHCQTLGGYILCSNKKKLGFDLEEESRVTERTLNRIQPKESIEAPPNPALGWSALEATFKALSGALSLKQLSQIRVSNWEPISPNAYLFKPTPTQFEHQIDVKGLSFRSQGYVISILAL